MAVNSLAGKEVFLRDLLSRRSVILVVLYLHVWLVRFSLRQGEDSLRRSLQKRLWAVQTGQWPLVERWLPLLVRLLPFSRGSRCLLASVIAFRYVRQEGGQHLHFVIGVCRESRGKPPRFHAWLRYHGENLFDTDATSSYQPFFTYPAENLDCRQAIQ